MNEKVVLTVKGEIYAYLLEFLRKNKLLNKKTIKQIKSLTNRIYNDLLPIFESCWRFGVVSGLAQTKKVNFSKIVEKYKFSPEVLKVLEDAKIIEVKYEKK
jgi:aspartate-semialdehyde dehydrogenase